MSSPKLFSVFRMIDFFYKTTTSIKSKRLPVTSIIHNMENVLSPANVSGNNSRHAKWVALGNLTESFIYIWDWNREAMTVLLCNVIQASKKKKRKEKGYQSVSHRESKQTMKITHSQSVSAQTGTGRSRWARPRTHRTYSCSSHPTRSQRGRG